jgi:hypothetical protein
MTISLSTENPQSDPPGNACVKKVLRIQGQGKVKASRDMSVDKGCSV